MNVRNRTEAALRAVEGSDGVLSREEDRRDG
jgi:hypothetical protein